MQTSFNVYYQTAAGDSKKLNHILVEDVSFSDKEAHVEAIQEVLGMLHKNMESYFKPVLTVINGGKA